MNKNVNISIIGTGNVSWHLGHALVDAGYAINQVIGRNEVNTQSYAKAFNADPVYSVNDLDPSVDVVFICVSDDQVQQVEEDIPAFDGQIAHTSGSMPLHPKRENCNVFYPLQSFSKDVAVSFSSIPILLEGHSVEAVSLLREIAQNLSNNVYEVSTDQREKLHVAAVFANNFTNHLFEQAYNICVENNIPFDILHPLIQETAFKAIHANPADSQTGPASRNDQTVIEKHLSLITDKNQRTLYRVITDSILANNETKL